MALVLLVDDEPMLRSALRQYLEFAGHSVIEAADGAAALAAIRHERPDLVVTDVLMPHMDGLELCRTARADPALAALPILFITARSTRSEIDDEMERIGDGCVVKPFEPNDLLTAIERAVAQRPR